MLSPVKIGIEIEYLVSQDERPIESGYLCGFASKKACLGLAVLESAAREIDPHARMEYSRGTRRWVFRNGSFLIPDSFSLLETVTAPSCRLDDLCEQLWMLKRGLIAGAAQHGCQISGAACPVSYRFDDMEFAFGRRCNNAGMHVHLDAATDSAKQVYCSILMPIIPELIAMSANSPIHNRKETWACSYRLQVSPMAKTRKMLLHDPERFRESRAQSREDRYEFLTPFSRSNKTVEIRGMDTPMNIDWAMAFAAFLQCLATRVQRIADSRDMPARQPFDLSRLEENSSVAVGRGIQAGFSFSERHLPWHCDGSHPLWRGRDMPYPVKDGRLSARKSIGNLLACIEEDARLLDAEQFLQHLYKMVETGINQAEQQRIWMARGGFEFYMEKLQEMMARPPDTLLQRTKGSDTMHPLKRKSGNSLQESEAIYGN
ncbi:MAG: hypothetical protein JJU29_01785 [Verrucomicrobia bacterium]|nr:hypothetical protein [Verrucomicrobiota bacterium]MCH8510964.1 hypothetical protein [Kiritimatiellia bacterium]